MQIVPQVQKPVSRNGSARPDHWKGREHLRQKGLKKARKAAVETIQRNAAESYSDLLPTMREMRDAGKSLQAIADHLNEQGHTTRRGCPWNRMQVSRVLKN